ncbi:Deoxyhypusine hydroxylase, partial [Dirofilaria immitis]
FFPGQWGQCSTTCGPGIATRTVECIAIQGITSNIIKLPDYECEGSIKPNEFQPCQIQPCTSEESANDDIPVRERSLTSTRSFKWDYGDWTICSASCLGGKQRSTLKCVDVKRRTAVAWSFCNAKQRPVDLTRSCNNDPCPPEWDIGEMSQCSHTCGGGVRSRKVRCIRRISRTGGAESTLILPDGQCPQPKPVNSEACGLVDCPAMWKITNWGQCSTTCGPGEQRRDVTCEQRLADGELKQFYPPIQCRHIEKPPTVQLCDLGMCNSLSDSIFRKSDNDKITTSMSTFTQQNGAHSRKLTLNIGGSAKLFVGTSLKVKCPVRNYAKNKIIWTKNGKKITNSAHIKVSSNGALRIFHARMEDAGVYACIANGIQGNVTLSFKPREEKDENGNDSRSMLNQNMPYNDVENDPIAVDQQLLQKVRQSLKNNEDFRMLERLADVTEPGNIKIDYAAGEWSKCSHYECGKSGRAQVRQLKCRISYQGSIGYLDDDVCESFGVMRPPSSRSCLPSYCPRWQTSSWSEHNKKPRLTNTAWFAQHTSSAALSINQQAHLQSFICNTLHVTYARLAVKYLVIGYPKQIESMKMRTDSEIDVIGRLLNDSKQSLCARFRALFILRNLGCDRSVKWIGQCFDDPSALLKHELAYCLGQTQNETAIPILEAVLKDENQEIIVRHEAGEALGAIGSCSSTAVLEKYVNDEAQALAETCSLALRRIRWLQESKNDYREDGGKSPYNSVDPTPASAETNIDKLSLILTDTAKPLWERYQALFSLRNINTDESIKALAKGLTCSDSALFRHEVAYALGQAQSPIVVAELIHSLENKEENHMVRHECAEALGAIATKECKEVLRKFRSDPERVVRESCEVALDMAEYESSGQFQYALINSWN